MNWQYCDKSNWDVTSCTDRHRHTHTHTHTDTVAQKYTTFVPYDRLLSHTILYK